MNTTAALYETAVAERYQMLRRALVIARSRPDWGLRLDQAEAIRQEKRALVRIRWFVRRESRRVRQPAGMDYHTWQAWDDRKARYDALQLADVS